MNLLYHFSLTLLSLLGTPPTTAIMAPVVNLGPDVIACDSYMLDAGNPGAGFLWSTGATSQTLNVASSGVYWVDVTDGSGTTRDSINMTILNTPGAPVINDTSLCGSGTYSFSPQHTGDWLLWYQQANSVLPYFIGNTQSPSISSTTTYYVESAELAQNVKAGQENPVGSSGYAFLSLRGLRFNVLSTFQLKSVSVIGDLAKTITIQIRDSLNNTIFTTTGATVPGVKTPIAINHVLYPGNNYKILVTSLPGGVGLTRITSYSQFPKVLPGVLSIIGDETGGTSLYNYFFDWRIDIPQCFSSRVPFTATILPSPEIELGPDTILCGGGITLDATFAGASYLWSTGETTPTIFVSNTDTVKIVVSTGLCSETDSVRINVLTVPQLLSTQDSSICEPATISLTAPKNADHLVWYDDPVSSQPIYIGNVYSAFIPDDKTYYVSAANTAKNYHTGLPQPGPANISYVSLANQGLSFDVLTPFTLKSFGAFANSPGSFNFQIRDANNQVLFSGTGQIPFAFAESKVTVNYTFVPGNNYKILATNIFGGAGMARQTGGTAFYPIQIPDVVKIKGDATGGNNLYNYFYNWEIDILKCFSPRDSIKVDVQIPISMPSYIYSCEATTISTAVPGFTHLWSTGATTPSIPVTESGIYSVIVSNGTGCVVNDTTEVVIPVNAGLQEDGILCGNTLLTNYGSGAVFSWSTGDTTATVNISSPGTYWVVVDEPGGCLLTDTIHVTGFDVFPTVNLGGDFTVCESAVLDAGNPNFQIQWSTGATSPTLTVFSSGTYTVTVTNTNGCATSDTIGVSVIPVPEALFFVPDTVAGTNFAVTFNNLSDFGAYFWNFGDGTTGTANNPVHTYNEPGEYCPTLIVTDLLNSCGQDTFSRCFTLLEYNVGLEKDLFYAAIEVFPNPADKEIFFRYHDIPHGVEVSLTDLSGKTIRKTDKLKMDISPYSPGVYLLRFEASDGRKTVKKLIIR